MTSKLGYVVRFRTFWAIVRDCLKTREREGSKNR